MQEALELANQEIETLKAGGQLLVRDRNDLREELATAQADKAAYAQNAVDLRQRVDELRIQLGQHAKRDALLRALLSDDIPLRVAARIEAALSVSAGPSAPVERYEHVAIVDAAMVEMEDIHPPLKRSECERPIDQITIRMIAEFLETLTARQQPGPGDLD